LLIINLDYPKCLKTKLYSDDAGFGITTPEQIINIGEKILFCLFKKWKDSHKKIEYVEGETKKTMPGNPVPDREISSPNTELEYFLPPDTPIIISEKSDENSIYKTIFRSTINNLNGEEEIYWVANALLGTLNKIEENKIKITLKSEKSEKFSNNRWTLNAPFLY